MEQWWHEWRTEILPSLVVAVLVGAPVMAMGANTYVMVFASPCRVARRALGVGSWRFIETMNQPYVGRPWRDFVIGVVVIAAILWAFGTPH